MPNPISKPLRQLTLKYPGRGPHTEAGPGYVPPSSSNKPSGSGVAVGDDLQRNQEIAERNRQMNAANQGAPSNPSTTSGYFAGMPVTGTDWFGDIYNESGQRSSAPEWLRWMSTITDTFNPNGVTYVTPIADIREIRQAKERGAKKGDSGMLELREKKKPRYRGG